MQKRYLGVFRGGYHREDGKVFKEFDDLMSATRYALMMLRFAKTKSFTDKWRPMP